MALSNIFNEPRREITESIIGMLVVAVWPVLTITIHHFVGKTWEDQEGRWILAVFAPLAIILLMFFTHFVGEEFCDWMRNTLQFDPRPRRH